MGDHISLKRAEQFRNRPVQKRDEPVTKHIFDGKIRASATANCASMCPRAKSLVCHTAIIVAHKENSRGTRIFRIMGPNFTKKSATVPPAAVHENCRNFETGQRVKLYTYTPQSGSSWPDDRSYLLPPNCPAKSIEAASRSEDRIIALMVPYDSTSTNDESVSKTFQLFKNIRCATDIPNAIQDAQDSLLASAARAHNIGVRKCKF